MSYFYLSSKKYIFFLSVRLVVKDKIKVNTIFWRQSTVEKLYTFFDFWLIRKLEQDFIIWLKSRLQIYGILHKMRRCCSFCYAKSILI